MDLELYRTFLAIVDSGSFTAAARHVNLTQSAVSQQVRRLEDMLGQPLFERLTGAVVPTEYGKSILRPARSMLETQSEILQIFRPTTFQGVVVVGVADAYVNRILKDVTDEFMKLLPEAAMSVIIDDSLGLSRRIAEGSVDLAFVTEGNCPTRGPIAFNDRLVVVGPVAGEVHKADPLPLAVWDERNEDEIPLIRFLESSGRRHRVAYVCRSVHAQHVAVTTGRCAAVLVEGSMIPGERAYLEEDGFPVLKHLTIRLERTFAKRTKVIEQLQQHYLDFFASARLPLVQ